MLFVYTLLLVILFSCKKVAVPYYGTIYATVNSAVDTFNANVLVFKDSTQGTYSLSVVGFHSAYGDSTVGGFETAEAGFEIFSPKPITTGTYTTDSASGNRVTLVYVPAQSSFYDSILPVAVSHPVVVISQITTTAVQGTFNGPAFYSDSTSASGAAITNGSFNVNFYRP